MAFPIPTSLDLQVRTGAITCNCCNRQSNPEDSYVVLKNSIPPNVVSKMVYPNHYKAKKMEEDQKVYTKLEEYLAKKVGNDKAAEIMGDKQFPLRLRDINEKRTIAEREVMRSLLNGSASPLPQFATKPSGSESKDKTLSIEGEYPGSFKPAILAGKIERTTEASPQQIETITKNIQSTLYENYSGTIDSNIIRKLLVNELLTHKIKVKMD